jgi:thymidine kinase
MAKLYFYYSTMNAGKSTTLLQSSYNYNERGMETLLFAPDFDTRFGGVYISSRIGVKKEAIGFNGELNLFKYVEERIPLFPKLACVLIDEAHFLTKNQVKQLTQITNNLKIPVLCYGLRSDFKGEPFEGSMYLLTWAEELTEIKGICMCGRKATMNLRIDDQGNPLEEGAQVQVGGNKSYISMCMRHFREKNKKFCESQIGALN